MSGIELPLPLVRLRQRSRRLTNRALGGLRNARYLNKWLVLGAMIGVVAGVGAIVFYSALLAGTHWLLGSLGGYHPATTAGEGGYHPPSAFARPWAIPLVVGGGGLAAGLLIFRWAPEAEGHGTDAAIEAVHQHPTGMRARVAAVKIIASALTIGSGGSGGREGPTAQIAATFGSMMARVLNLSPADARIAVSAGIASGIGAIFRAPLGGALLGAELLYRDDVESEALIPSVIASIVAFAVFGSVEGFSPIFGNQSAYHFDHVAQLGWFAVLGIVAGGMGRLYATVFYGVIRLSKFWPRFPALRVALGGVLVGLLGLAVPAALGTGYGFVQQGLDLHALRTMSLWLVVAVPFAKILATALSIGSGGSGGVFGPGIVIGASTGVALWRLLDGVSSTVPHTPIPFVIVGMIACFGAVAHAPISVMLMVAEMTGNLSLLAPAMVALALATLVVGDVSIYSAQPRTRADSPAHRATFGLPLASTIPVADVMAVPRLVLRANTDGEETLHALLQAGVPGAPVVDGNDHFIGSVHTPALAQRIADGWHDTVGRAADAEAVTVSASGGLDAALEALATSKGDWVPVLDDALRVVGIVGTSDVVRAYRLALRTSMRRLGRAAKGSVFAELVVVEGSAAAGRPLSDLRLPAHTVVVAVLRRGNLLFADAGTVLQPGDTVSIVARAGMHDTLERLLATPQAAAAGGEAAGAEPDAAAEGEAARGEPDAAAREADFPSRG